MRSLLGLLPFLFVTEASAQTASPDEAMVQMMENQGCKATETQMIQAISSAGGGISDAQAIIVNMANNGDLIWDGSSSYVLVKTERCP